MKSKINLLAVLIFLSFSNSYSQTNPVLYGMTASGGGSGIGTIFKINADGTGRTTIHDFGSPKGNTPIGDLLLASDGNLYGMTLSGGSNNSGVIFKYDTTAGTVTTLHHFDVSSGAFPNGSLIQAANGLLYGMANSGGTHGLGVIFSFDYTTNTYTDLWNFIPANGEYPVGNLLQANNGLLYGMTPMGGGPDSMGTIFSFNINLDTLIVLKNFDTVSNGTGSGGQPRGSLMQASDGKLYGVARNNGQFHWGTIFKLDPANNQFTKIHDFDGANGFYPTGTLIENPNGLLFGMTQGFLSEPTDGNIFSINRITYSFLSRVSFYTKNFGNPYGSLHMLSNGKMYGMAYHGVQGVGDSSGVLFCFDPTNNDSLTILHQFQSSSGNYPQGSLIYLNNKLFGMTSRGGIFNSGTIFNLDTAGINYSDLYDFYGGGDGNSPNGTLVKAGNGLLYGMTEFGGQYSKGTIFSVDTATDVYSLVYSFDGTTHGAYPVGNLVLASDGNLWGTTQYGGGLNSGIVFIFNTSADSIVIKDHFQADHGVSTSELIEASNGKLYGVTAGHGNGEFGCLYSIDMSNPVINRLMIFDTTSIGYPFGSLFQASNTLLYGMSSSGSINNVGSIYYYNTVTNTWGIASNFNILGGGNPFGKLIQANNGNLYGLTKYGGSDGYGTLFNLNPVNNNLSIEHSFHAQFPNEGYFPLGSLIQSRNGKLYGMTSRGGSNTDTLGTIFEFDIFNHTYSQIMNFNTANGAYPTYNNFYEEAPGTSCFAYFSAYPDSVGSHNYHVVNLSTGTAPVTYSWDFGDGNTSTNQYPWHAYSSNGNYVVCLTIHDGTGCQSTYCDTIHSADTINIMSAIAAGISTISSNPKTFISLFPNPFSNSCTIRFNNMNQSNTELCIYDLSGKEMNRINVSNTKEITMSRDNLASGMYFYKLIKNKNEVLYNGKFVVE